MSDDYPLELGHAHEVIRDLRAQLETEKEAHAATQRQLDECQVMMGHAGIALDLTARLRAAEALVRELEGREHAPWGHPDVQHLFIICPCCGRTKREGHAPDCRLAAWLEGRE